MWDAVQHIVRFQVADCNHARRIFEDRLRVQEPTELTSLAVERCNWASTWSWFQICLQVSQGYLVPPCLLISSKISITLNVSRQGMCSLSLRPFAMSTAALSASNTNP